MKHLQHIKHINTRNISASPTTMAYLVGNCGSQEARDSAVGGRARRGRRRARGRGRGLADERPRTQPISVTSARPGEGAGQQPGVTRAARPRHLGRQHSLSKLEAKSCVTASRVRGCADEEWGFFVLFLGDGATCEVPRPGTGHGTDARAI